MNSSENYYYINIFNDALVNAYKYIVPIIYILTNIENLLCILIFSKKTWRKNVCVFYFQIYLFSNTCYINSTVLGTIFTYGYNINLQNSNIILCKLFYYVAYVFAILSPTILILASIDRLLISSQNIDTRLYSSKRLAYFSISLSTCFWIIFNFHILIKVGIYELYPSVYLCYYDRSKSYRDFVSYYLAIVNICFCLIMIILCIFSFKNIRHIKIVRHRQRNQIRSMTKKDFQLLRCLFAHGIAYVFFRIGINMYFGYEAITRDVIRTSLHQAIDIFLNNFLSLLFNISYSISFFIYIIISKAFRHELKRMIYKIFGRDLIPIRDVELNVVVVSCTVISPN
ncbi:unnamed protein product [Adineta steineri]|uniref:G-protein coupled receptors family 1 profile domain-containing protein n=1 Tax=Adineta steineri TaxID=433720 RepID=A0A818HW99_9BILA|nr:unnamed protein product [Adineta steineri]CAF3515700.1 unnamed protein product [Adineta steineri]